MSTEPTKNPAFTAKNEIEAENARRKQLINAIRMLRPHQIRHYTRCHLDARVGHAVRPFPGEILYVRATAMLDNIDRRKLFALKHEANRELFDHDSYNPDVRGSSLRRRKPTAASKARVQRIETQIDVLLGKGSDRLRAVVGRAASWASVPPELLAAVLQSENSPRASGIRRGLQALERDLQATIGAGSTGFGNVKPATLRLAKKAFGDFYKWPLLRPGVRNVPQNSHVETDIFHAAGVLRNGLNLAWSGGGRSLNKLLGSRFAYYPYFGGGVTEEVAVRAMGHYNGMGDGALKYGQNAMNKIKSRKLHFLPATGR